MGVRKERDRPWRSRRIESRRIEVRAWHEAAEVHDEEAWGSGSGDAGVEKEKGRNDEGHVGWECEKNAIENEGDRVGSWYRRNREKR